MASHVVWIKPDGRIFSGRLSERPFIAKHYPLPDAGKAMLIPFTHLRDRGVNMIDINTATIASRVTEELETMEEVELGFHFDTSEGTIIFAGCIESEATECSIQ